MNKLFNGLLLSIVLVALNITEGLGQCAMCKATVESGENAETYGAGLNAGILYLMSIPYILFAVIAFLWYRNSKKNKVKREQIQARLKKSLSQ